MSKYKKYCCYCGKYKNLSEFCGYYINVCNKCRYNNAIKTGLRFIFLNRIYNKFIKRKIKRLIRAEELLGNDVLFVAKYIQKHFKKGMTWKNHGLYGWHIDHIRPCASFDLSKPEEQKKCFNYKNLQPIWWYNHLQKTKEEKKNYFKKL